MDPLLAPSDAPGDGPAADGEALEDASGTADAEGAEPELVEDGSERADGSIVECPPLECVEQPGERDSELPRYPDDPCLGVDLSTLRADEGTESGEGDAAQGEGGSTEPDDTGGTGSTGEEGHDAEGGQSATDGGVTETGEPERS
ncbi:hypothetical protein [Candidatus Poriferisodalis multihospitum]|uniref:hypothetical protein n=1 Tax=Candidatus Poriferisodalis multihospitum TaxID=2983191 RepID=UPI002B257F12|nr:hypothetical protein [Candidatus Poriferisodalis multihospitum]